MRKEKSETEKGDIHTFSVPLLHTSSDAFKAGLSKLANDAGILQ